MQLIKQHTLKASELNTDSTDTKMLNLHMIGSPSSVCFLSYNRSPKVFRICEWKLI